MTFDSKHQRGIVDPSESFARISFSHQNLEEQGFENLNLSSDQIGRDLDGFPNQNDILIPDSGLVESRWLVDRQSFVPQLNDWSCGVAIYQMARKCFRLAEMSFDQTVSLLGATKENGVSNDQLEAAFKELRAGFEIVSGFDGLEDPELSQKSSEVPGGSEALVREFSKLSDLLKEGFLIIVNFREPVREEGHYAIVNRVGDDLIELADPWFGMSSRLKIGNFDWRSGFMGKVIRAWHLAVRPVF